MYMYMYMYMDFFVLYLPDSVECLAQFCNLEWMIDGTNACMYGRPWDGMAVKLKSLQERTYSGTHVHIHTHTLTIFCRVLILVQISPQYGVVHDIDVGWHGVV